MNKIKSIIFDVDGTLYDPIPDLTDELYRYWVDQLAQTLRISHEEAESTFQYHKKKYISATLALSALGLGSPRDVIKRAEHHMRPYHKKHIIKDRKLIQILKVLKHEYRLATLRNGTRAGTRYILSLLGFSKRRDKKDNGYGPFDFVLPTVELGPTKPDPEPFQNALRQLPFEPEEILIIGDRVKVDLAPAKQCGMKTALVIWGREIDYDHRDVDVVMDTIYEVKELIREKK